MSGSTNIAPCKHEKVACLNQYDLIRKYHCLACDGVMMCACDKTVGERFLSHQLQTGTELETQERVPVTLGFQPQVCSECRGLPADSAPMGEIHGRTTKIKRYYWRELFFAEKLRQAAWDDAHPAASETERREAHDKIEHLVLDEIKHMHATAPKYQFTDLSQAEVIERYNVNVVSIAAEYAEVPKKGAVIKEGNEILSAEEFVSRHYEAQHWSSAVTKRTGSPAIMTILDCRLALSNCIEIAQSASWMAATRA